MIAVKNACSEQIKVNLYLFKIIFRKIPKNGKTFVWCCGFVQLTLVKWSTRCHMVSESVQRQIIKEIQIKQLITHGSWRKYITCFKGLHGRSKLEYEVENRTWGHMS